jgi:hypothetical protein
LLPWANPNLAPEKWGYFSPSQNSNLALICFCFLFLN